MQEAAVCAPFVECPARFIGLFGLPSTCFHIFVGSYPTGRCQPFHQLLKKDAEGRRVSKAFDTIKALLKRPPVLAAPVKSNPMHVNILWGQCERGGGVLFSKTCSSWWQKVKEESHKKESHLFTNQESRNTWN